MLLKEYRKKLPYYFLAIFGSLSTAGAVLTLLALSANLYETDQEGVASSSIYALQYLGIATVGFIGGWTLQRFTAIFLGLFGAFISAIIVFFLASFSQIHPIIGLPIIFLLFLISGIDHPNNIRFFNGVLEEKEKVHFFSIKESVTYLFSLTVPTIAVFIIQNWGTRTCFLIDGITYLLSCLPWIFLKKKMVEKNYATKDKIKWFVGFHLLIKNKNIFMLNISRLLNNLSYVTWITALPLLIAKIAMGDVNLFAKEQGISTSLLSGGFILASLMGVFFSKHQRLISVLVWCSTLFGLSAIILLSLSLFQNVFLYVSAFLIGLGTYCFRISGITLGQAFTPKEHLGSVIIAGDMVVRGWSFFVSIATIGIFNLHENWELSIIGLSVLVTIFPVFSLFAPFLTRKLARAFIERSLPND